MKYKKLKLSLVLLLVLGLTTLHAQEAIIAAGGNSSGADSSVCYSIGQVAYNIYSSFNGSIAEGVQQPYEISEIDGIEETGRINLTCTAYPNPTTELLTLKVENINTRNLSYQLYDMNGKLLENKKLTGNETTIMMAARVSAVYFLKVSDNDKVLKSFKLLKN